MGFSSRLKGSFYCGIRERGAVYARTGKVRILDETPDQLVAQVRGHSRYEVVLDWRDGSLKVACTCPYFDEVGPCKHIWAVALESDRRGLLGAVPAAGRVPVEPDPALVGVPGDGDEEKIDRPDPGPPAPALRSRVQDINAVVRRGSAGREAWRASLDTIRGAIRPERTAPPAASPAELFYAIDRDGTIEDGRLLVRIGGRRRNADGLLSAPYPRPITRQEAAAIPEPADRQTLALLFGAEDPREAIFSYSRYQEPGRSIFAVDAAALGVVLPALCHTGRLGCLAGDVIDADPYAWDDGPPWELRLRVREREKGWLLEGCLAREGREMDLGAADLLLQGGFVFAEKRIARLDDHGSFQWIGYLRREGSISVPASEGDSFAAALHELPALPPTDWPEPFRWQERSVAPRPSLGLEPGNSFRGAQALIDGRLSFLYEDTGVRDDDPRPRIGVAARREVLLRDPAAESAAREKLLALGFRKGVVSSWPGPRKEAVLQIAPRRLPGAVRELIGAGWLVEAAGKLYRRSGGIEMEVSSGIDWFDLEGEVDFEGQTVSLPALLSALRRGEGTVILDDGTFGVIPEEWLKKYGFILGSGKVEDEKIRFRKTQLGLLDFLLAEEPQAAWDAAFERARAELRSFERLEPCDPTGEFRGTLRPYQRDGLGWLEFLRRFGFGGCLADDMGLGKTVQVLALLESRRHGKGGKKPEKPGPSLVVVPKSLVFNWKSEAARFAPRLEVLDHTGIERSKDPDHLRRFDLVITTYGTLRRDAAFLQDVAFDYVILDESQAVKNARTQSAKVVRLLKGSHRLALSGTPIENHLGELWSLFEFLNPGMLGSSPVFDGLARAAGGNGDSLLPLKRALRPFILRRTKDQVLDDLPPKLEQTIHCDLEPAERKHYDEIRAYYRASLLGTIERAGLERSKIQVLEALLRLRQAACHPGLVDRRRTGEPSAKLELLLDRIEEVGKEGHKALVFSQFTKFLAIVKDRLDRRGITYEYLDGRTRDRAARVERFQGDPACKLFLVSLKAGGLGLNLTAAEYVFLLDPWWNPAVESQAVDRAHRIGQTRRVFAYRLVARDTVEEKVLELQERKRSLADAIISAENSLIRELTREDLEVLLS
ncbi:MAG TPA: SNF2-related protein [Planctomycetota bacterium]|nr:SNF2-related protein [Planctomycetota bacterium]